MELRDKIGDSLSRAIAWVERNQYCGYEPADGNLSPLHVLTRQKVFPMRILQQMVLRAPFNIRPLIGITPHESSIGRGYIAWAYLILLHLKAEEAIRRGAIACLEWLIANRSQRSIDFCWGDPYEYATRGGRRPYGEPLLIWSSLIGLAFLDAYETLRDERFLRVAESTGRWILSLPRHQTPSGTCLSYVAYRQSSIHNSNVMGAAFLARLGALTSSSECLKVAASAMAYTCARQRKNGSWYYAEEPIYHWIDNFHTGYNLCALKVYKTATKDGSFDLCIEKGLWFYKNHFFEADGRPKYFHDKTYPIDIQCAAQSIETLAAFSEYDVDCVAMAKKIAAWTIDNLQARDGHFFYRDLGWKKIKTPMVHWGQGTMIKALAVLLRALAPMSA
jgi:hypothetical protein